MIDPAWLRELADARENPWTVADRWHASGGRVVGVFGDYAPTEIVRANGALPIRLDPGRLSRPDAARERLAGVPEGLKGELAEGPLSIVSGLLTGDLGWIDGLLIGRDSEAHTKLFYVIREMAGDPEFAARIPHFAFCDLLRLPARTSAVYNRVRLRQLQETVAGWWGDAVSGESLSAAISEDAAIRRLLRELARLRADRRLTGRDLLVATAGARVLPSAEAASALSAAVAAVALEPQHPVIPTVMVTGSEPTAEIYEAVEACGLAIVGDDHREPMAWPEGDGASVDPIDALADAYQFSSVGAARAGLDRAVAVAGLARQAGVDAVLQIVRPDDEASEWELAELQGLLRPIPVISVGLDPAAGYEALRDASASLLSRLAGDSQPARMGGEGLLG